MRPILFLLAVCFILFSACKDQPKAVETPEPVVEESTQPNGSFLATPQQWLDSIANKVTQIDYVFFNLPISLALTDPPAIRSAFAQMDAQHPVPLSWDCPSIARIFYVANGETVGISELYFSQGCTYLRFYEGNTMTTAVRLNEMGIKFLLNLKVPFPKMQAPSTIDASQSGH
ncbi:MAG: hypothetical protein K9I85_01820 [Saprospiraceae bacterium]|nr:hypothetical protein [Saprospiraceae bacterium]